MKTTRHAVLETALALAVLAAVGFSVYSNTLDVGFRFDGHAAIEANESIRDFSKVIRVEGGPTVRKLPYLSYYLNYRLAGLEVSSWHLVNILIHVLAAFFLFLLGKATFRTPSLKDSDLSPHAAKIALFGALIFLCHPVQTQAVTYIYQRFTSMAGLFYIATVYFYARARLRGGWSGYLPFAASALAGLFTRESVYTLPAAVLLYELCFFEREGRRALKKFLVFAGACAVLASLFFLSYRHMIAEDGLAVVLFKRFKTDFPWYVYLMTQFPVMVGYLRLLFSPVSQNLDYDVPLAAGMGEPRIFASLVFLLGLAAWALARFRRNPLMAFAVLWFFITLSVESTIIPLPDIMVEHRLYLPMAGFALVLPAALWRLTGDTRKASVLLMVIVVCFSALAIRRNEVWRDELRLWRDAARKSPNKRRTLHNVGKTLLELGRPEEAATAFERARDLDPANVSSRQSLSTALLRSGRIDESLEVLNGIIADGKVSALTYDTLGACMMRKGEYAEAERFFRKSLELKWSSLRVRNNVGVALARQKKFMKAAVVFKGILKNHPDYVDARSNLEMVTRKIRERKMRRKREERRAAGEENALGKEPK